jgi:aminopeptidase
MAYTPPKEILDKYADVMVNYGLRDGKGIKKGDRVFIQIWQGALPILPAVYEKVLKAGGHPLVQVVPAGVDRLFYQHASDDQLKFFPKYLLKGRVEEMDQLLQILAEDDMHELEGIDPKKIMTKQSSAKQYIEWRHEKENKGKLSWTLCMYGTEAMAKEAGMSIEEYWEQIIKACYLDEKDPIKKWRETMSELRRIQDAINKLRIDKLHIVAPDTDLIIGLPKKHKWVGGTGHNIPSFELFTTPDCRRTEGKIQFTQPLYRYGNKITDVYLEFKKGKVVKATASQNEKMLKEMIATPGADMAGEISLTDGRMSRITKFMAETLFDENVGGRFGNTHLALGRAYTDCYMGNPAKVPKAQWKKMGYNDSVVHTDIVATSDRTVTATLQNGKVLVIYKDGKFTI